MPKLVCLADISGKAAGFVLPIFQERAGANQYLIQQLDEYNTVIAFDELLAGEWPVEAIGVEMYADIGRSGIWAFRDDAGEVHIGDAVKIETVGLKLLRTGALENSPMAAAEMASFCKVENEFPKTLQDAFSTLETFSAVSAETWRDIIVLLPAIKADLDEKLGKRVIHKEEMDQILAVSHGNVTNIYAPERLALIQKDLPRWRKLARIFGINRFQLHPIQKASDFRSKQQPDWSLVGVGGIARFVIKRPPFNGSLSDGSAPRGGAIARGRASLPDFFRIEQTPVTIGVIGSDIRDAQTIDRRLASLGNGRSFRHVINIRPIGFGTPNPRKASPQTIFDAISGLDALWLVTAHRLRQTGSHTNSMSASNIASRYVRAAASGLIACVRSKELSQLLLDSAEKPGIGLVGAARHFAGLDMDEMIIRVLYTMLCEDAYLHSAARILVLWPYQVEESAKHRVVRIGQHQYAVELMSYPRPRGAPDIIGYALNVMPSARTASDFADFLSTIFAGYGWVERHRNTFSILFENEGESLRVWPTISIDRIATLAERKAEYGNGGDLIVTNQTVREPLRERAAQSDWGLIHYSEVERWMRANFRASIFQDW